MLLFERVKVTPNFEIVNEGIVDFIKGRFCYADARDVHFAEDV